MILREKIWNRIAAVNDVGCTEERTNDGGASYRISFQVKLNPQEYHKLSTQHHRSAVSYVRRTVRSGLRLFFRPDDDRPTDASNNTPDVD